MPVYIIIFMYYILIDSLFAKSHLCPDGFSPLIYTSPITSKEVKTCTKRINGKIIQKKPLINEKKASSMNVEAKVALKEKVLGISTKIFLSLVNKSQKGSLGSFSTRNCQGSRREWGRFLLGNISDIKFNYFFAKGCSLQGIYKPKLRKAFPLGFEVRDIEEVKRVDMSLLIDPTLDRKSRSLVTVFTVKNMQIKGPQFQAIIRAKYKVAYGHQGTVIKNYGGKIKILSINNETLNVTEEEVYIPIDE